MRRLLIVLAIICVLVTTTTTAFASTPESTSVQKYNCSKTEYAGFGTATINAWVRAEKVFNQFFSRIISTGVDLTDNSWMFNFEIANESINAYIVDGGKKLRLYFNATLKLYWANGTWYENRGIGWDCTFIP